MTHDPLSDCSVSAQQPTRHLHPWAELLDEQKRRWREGDRQAVEYYLQRYPALASWPEGLVDLIRNEIRLREADGEQPTLAEYLQRFPQVAVLVRQRFALDPAARNGPPPVREGLAVPSAANAAPSDRPQVAGYEILTELGRGGMGVVYQARQLQLNRLVALKMILVGAHAGAEELVRFRTEAEAIARLHHPNIVEIYEIGEADGRPYFALELISGSSLASLRGPILQPIRWTAQLIAIVARAVHHCHQRGVVHRDLKPANILFQRLGEETPPASDYVLPFADGTRSIPKITDFGLAKRIDLAVDQTRTGTVLGTPSYMAPEQASGQSQRIGPAADIYALGALLYDLLTGRPPFQGDSLLTVLDQVRTEEPVAPRRLNPKVPRDLETICLKCLEKEPSARYASAYDLAEDLQHFLRDEPIQAQPASVWQRGWKWMRRQPLLAMLLGLVVFTVAALTLVTFFSFWNARRLVDNRRHVQHTLEVLLEVRQLASLLKEAETSQRGYLLTGDPIYLKTCEAARRQIPGVWQHLRHLTQDNPRQTTRLDALRDKMDERLRILQQVIAVRQGPDGLQAAISAVQAGQGRRSMAEARAILEEIEAEEQELLDQRNRAEEATTRTAMLTLLVSVSLAGLLVVASVLPAVSLFRWRSNP